MSQVKRVRKGIRVRLESEEAALTRALMEQLIALIADPGADAAAAGEAGASGAVDQEDDLAAALGINKKAERPRDPVLARLFPDGYSDDPDAAGEFRRYTEVGLRDAKRAAATTVLETLRQDDEIMLDEEQAQAWLRALNDVRLALGTRLDISEEWYDEVTTMNPDDPRFALYAAYDWLTALQDSLIRAL